MRVLVTRPAPACARTAARLAERGHHPILLPLTEARHDAAAVEAALSQPFRALALTSGEAVAALSILPDAASAIGARPVFCVGAATARAARTLGLSQVITGPGDGEGLAHEILARETLARSSIAARQAEGAPSLLYLAGRPRAPAFEAALAEAGLAVVTVEAYAMQACPIDAGRLRAALVGQAPQAALFYSREAPLRLAALAAEQALVPAFCRILCMSPRVADAVPAAWGPVLVPPSPDEDTLLALLA
ncbi:hypothetical protein BTR14_08610 [Rhizobium rhizosphaerae]|uniref:Uroporphyrinogen-III synthase n=1 Tax=Xaviernesmea rhizosphaerae TaxID=1672749 RepID=A0ABX3PEQ6_9HYPH|nr:uroporphyrinogen-III synthase [Xaviernesmea rhizosphaerae]OQP86981.1 hypothetical protein BTR14_08610 [Xaviernesmea rhizosphaerae]